MFINDVGQNTWEEINDGIAGANYGWPTTEGPTTDPQFSESALRATTTRPAVVRDHRRRVLRAADAAVSRRTTSATISSRTICGGWIRKLDPADRQAVADFATGISFAGRSQGRPTTAACTTWRAAPAARPASSSRSTTARRRRASRRIRRAGRWRPARRSPSACGRPARRRCAISGSATAPTFRARPRRTTRSRRSPRRDNGARFRAVVSNDFGSVTEQRGGADGHGQPGADGDDHAAGGRHALQRRHGHQLRGHRHAIPKTARCRRARSPGGSTSITTRTRIRSSRRRTGATQRLVHDSDDGRDGGQRLVSHLPDRPGFRRAHAHDRSATSCRARRG